MSPVVGKNKYKGFGACACSCPNDVIDIGSENGETRTSIRHLMSVRYAKTVFMHAKMKQSQCNHNGAYNVK